MMKNLYQDKPEVHEIYPEGNPGMPEMAMVKFRHILSMRMENITDISTEARKLMKRQGKQLSYDNVILQYCYGEVKR